MDNEKSIRLLQRQIRDIQVQADKILEGDQSVSNLESFSKYCLELKSFISNHIQSPSIREYITDLPQIDYKRNEIKLWQYLLLPSYFIELYKEYHAKNKTLQEIATARGKFASLELLIRGL